jgi:hypothetical protein
VKWNSQRKEESCTDLNQAQAVVAREKNENTTRTRFFCKTNESQLPAPNIGLLSFFCIRILAEDFVISKWQKH